MGFFNNLFDKKTEKTSSLAKPQVKTTVDFFDSPEEYCSHLLKFSHGETVHTLTVYAHILHRMRKEGMTGNEFVRKLIGKTEDEAVSQFLSFLDNAHWLQNQVDSLHIPFSAIKQHIYPKPFFREIIPGEVFIELHLTIVR